MTTITLFYFAKQINQPPPAITHPDAVHTETNTDTGLSKGILPFWLTPEFLLLSFLML